MLQVIKIGSRTKFITIFLRIFSVISVISCIPLVLQCAFNALLYCIHLVQFEHHFNSILFLSEWKFKPHQEFSVFMPAIIGVVPSITSVP
jgi:hypothetical protein